MGRLEARLATAEAQAARAVADAAELTERAILTARRRPPPPPRLPPDVRDDMGMKPQRVDRIDLF